MSFHKPCSLLESQHLIGLSKACIYLVYIDKDDLWWSKYLKAGYRHVFAIKFDGLFWIRMDLTIGYTDFDVLLYDYKDSIDDIVQDNATYQHVEVWRKTRYRSILAPWTCVEMMKSLLGIKAWWILTPFQLYKYIEALKCKSAAPQISKNAPNNGN